MAAVLSRMFLAAIATLMLALGPIALPARASAVAPSQGHHGDMSSSGHCDDRQPTPGQDEGQSMSCCVAGCMAATVAQQAAQRVPGRSIRAQLPVDRARLGYIGEIATPPPRAA